ncbi:MAG TPA: CAP domain-containing protein [Acidimicrobiia bacterium]
MLKRCAVVLAALLACVAGPLGLGRALAGQDFAAMTNADRVANRLRALSSAGDLQSLAQQRANQMAGSGVLAHTQNLGSKVSNWQRLGENVGRGPNLTDIETAFMNSPAHRENILDPTFTQIGVGVTFDGARYFYVAVIFRQPMNTAAPAPAPAPAPRPAPAPVPRVASAPKPVTTTTRPPTTTTTQPPTTTTTAPPPPAAPVDPTTTTTEAPTTTTTAPRPIYTNQDFLAANFSDTIASVPASAVHPVRHPLPAPIVATAVLMVLGVGGATGATAALSWARVRPR